MRIPPRSDRYNQVIRLNFYYWLFTHTYKSILGKTIVCKRCTNSPRSYNFIISLCVFVDKRPEHANEVNSQTLLSFEDTLLAGSLKLEVFVLTMEKEGDLDEDRATAQFSLTREKAVMLYMHMYRVVNKDASFWYYTQPSSEVYLYTYTCMCYISRFPVKADTTRSIV